MWNGLLVDMRDTIWKRLSVAAAHSPSLSDTLFMLRANDVCVCLCVVAALLQLSVHRYTHARTLKPITRA